MEQVSACPLVLYAYSKHDLWLIVTATKVTYTYHKPLLIAVIAKTMKKRNGQFKKSRNPATICLKRKSTASGESKKLLYRLNSLNSPEELVTAIGIYDGVSIFGRRIAQKILNTRAALGNFQNLKQLVFVPGIGPKRFTTILSALRDCI